MLSTVALGLMLTLQGCGSSSDGNTAAAQKQPDQIMQPVAELQFRDVDRYEVRNGDLVNTSSLLLVHDYSKFSDLKYGLVGVIPVEGSVPEDSRSFLRRGLSYVVDKKTGYVGFGGLIGTRDQPLSFDSASAYTASLVDSLGLNNATIDQPQVTTNSDGKLVYQVVVHFNDNVLSMIPFVSDAILNLSGNEYYRNKPIPYEIGEYNNLSLIDPDMFVKEGLLVVNLTQHPENRIIAWVSVLDDANSAANVKYADLIYARSIYGINSSAK